MAYSNGLKYFIMGQKIYWIILFKILFMAPVRAGVFYVSTSGLPGNLGTMAQPWTITYAFQNAQPNDTVWIKAGNYNSVNLSISHPQTTFIGYTSVPGDLTPSSIPDSLNTFLQNSYDAIFPTIDGGNRAAAGIGIDFVSSNRINIVLKNFQIRNYQIGLSIVGKANWIENIIAYNFGDVNVFYSGTAISTYGNKNTIRNVFVLNGAAEGINIKGDSNLVVSSKVYCNDTISPHGDTDYYIYITANSGTKQGKYNRIEDCYIERISKYLPHLGHGGHGLCLTISYNHKPCISGSGYCYDSTQKDFVVENNIIRNCVTKNIFESVMLRGDGVRYNLIEGVTSLSYGSLNIQNSCRYNTFNRCHIKNSYYYKYPTSSSIYRFPGIDFRASYYGDSSAQNVPSLETNSYPWEVEFSAYHNTFLNCIFENVASGILFDSYAEYSYPSYHPLAGQAVDRVNRKRIVGNSFINCNFIAMKTDTITMDPVNRPTFMLSMRGTGNNFFSNCIIQGFHNFEGRSFALNTGVTVAQFHGIIPTMHTYSNCVFFGNGFDNQIPNTGVLSPVGNPPLVAGVNNTVGGNFSQCLIADPLFVDYLQKDYHLSPNSPCIDNGMATLVVDDYDGNQRPCGVRHDIGAYEYPICNQITGDLRYDNYSQTPLAGIPVYLKSLLGNIVASDTTDSAGVYELLRFPNGNYFLDALISYPWGGVNSTDALQVIRFFTSLGSLSPLRVKSGDVNGNGLTNSGDALLINRRATGSITMFAIGNFVHNLPSVNATGNHLVVNLRALSSGDVNGTYSPQPSAPALILDTVIAGPGSGTATVRFTSPGSGVYERGICWGTYSNPTVSDNKLTVGSGGYGFTQVFSGNMAGNQLHYARAFAKTSSGTFYSNEKSFIP